MFEPGVKSFGIFADDDQIYIRIARGNVRKIADRAEIGVQLEFLPQSYVDAWKSASDRRSYGTLESDVGALQRFDEFLGNIFARFLVGLGANRKRLPFELDPSRFQNANRGIGDFRSDSVARDKSYFVTHARIILKRLVVSDR